MRNIRKIEVIKTIGQIGVVGIVRSSDFSKAIDMGNGMINGGIRILEISMTSPDAINVIKTLKQDNSDKDFVLGAGTVADAATARMSILAGAEFIVSHCLSEDVVKTCNRYGIPCSPGVQSVTEAVKALELGCDVVKIFPGNVLGPGFIKAVHGPVPHLEMIPVGGVSLENLGDWFKAGAYAVGLGSALTKKDGRDGDYESVLKKSQATLQAIRAARE
jgi:2-dehydro-3-deoxyphosphogluconate aldolase/(4S)-4-hydroxy-2-oxoglutarate aldolase